MRRHPIAIAAAALLIAGCGSPTPTTEQPAEAVEVAATPESEPTDYLAQGKAEGYSAAVAAQTATGNDWNDVGLGWDAAMRSLRKVPADSPDYAEAQAKIEEYTANRQVASDRYNAHLAELAAQKIAANDGYRTYRAAAGLTGTTDIQWRWLKGAENVCNYGTCWTIEAIADEGCDRGLYVELSVADEADINIGMTNDRTGAIRPGQKARLTFSVLDKSAHKAGISKMSCL